MPRVNAKILVWARKTAGLTPEEAAEKLGINDAHGIAAVDRLAALESGTNEPSRSMLVKMSQQYRRPLLVFYMSARPLEGDRGQDFRTLPGGHPAVQDAWLDALIRDIRARQSMVRAVLEDEDEAHRLAFVGSAKITDGVATLVSSMQKVLGVDFSQFRSRTSKSNSAETDKFDLLRKKAEAAGVFVLLIGNLGSYHTTIDLEMFRGFALADEVAPFVIINDQDAKTAWSFTLLHELVHLWLGQTGVSGARAETALEKFCNDVAGEFLLPTNELAYLRVDNTTNFETALAQISHFAKDRDLSSSMVAYKLYRIGAIKLDTWQKLSGFFRTQWLQSRANRREGVRDQEGGPNYYVVRRHRIGSALIDLVRRTMADGSLTTSKAGKVLGVKPKNVQALVTIEGLTNPRRLA